jgi:hypothetical protein
MEISLGTMKLIVIIAALLGNPVVEDAVWPEPTMIVDRQGNCQEIRYINPYRDYSCEKKPQHFTVQLVGERCPLQGCKDEIDLNWIFFQ